MKSHSCDFTFKFLLGRVLRPIWVPIGFAFVIQFGAHTNTFPPPRPMSNLDQTVIANKVQATREAPGHDVILLGDSSCLMNVSATQLNNQLPEVDRVQNLGTLSYLDLDDYRLLMQEYLSHHPDNPPQAIVLLMHPEALRRPSSIRLYSQLLRDVIAGNDFCAKEDPFQHLCCWLGYEVLRHRFLGRMIPAPLSAEFRAHYGFSWTIEKTLREQRGSLVDPREFRPDDRTGSNEYRLAPQMRSKCLRFREALPPDTRLVIGITPIPSSRSFEGYEGVYQELLQQWSSWINAHQVMSLPPVLTDDSFASSTHLKESRIKSFTDQVARELRK